MCVCVCVRVVCVCVCSWYSVTAGRARAGVEGVCSAKTQPTGRQILGRDCRVCQQIVSREREIEIKCACVCIVVCVCVCDRERESVCVCAKEREREMNYTVCAVKSCMRMSHFLRESSLLLLPQRSALIS